MHRKDLLFAALAGTGLATVVCLALMPRNAGQPSPEPQTRAETKDGKRQDTPRLPSAATDSAPASAMPLPDNVPSHSATLAHRNRTARSAKMPELLPETQKVAASNTAHAPQESAALPSAPSPQNLDTPMPAQTITPQEARAALGKVGTDPEAEAVWIAAINDPNMPAKQRKDLIEDLNEEGFANPKQLTTADLPRIEKRIALIEELAPEAIDQTNADAFQEAYKDLKDMRGKLSKP